MNEKIKMFIARIEQAKKELGTEIFYEMDRVAKANNLAEMSFYFVTELKGQR